MGIPTAADDVTDGHGRRYDVVGAGTGHQTAAQGCKGRDITGFGFTCCYDMSLVLARC